MESQLRGFQSTGIIETRLELAEEDLDRGHQHLEETLVAYEQCLESLEDQEEMETMELERENLEEWATKSLRHLRAELRACLQHQDSRPGQTARSSNLQGVKLPIFSVKQKTGLSFTDCSKSSQRVRA